MAVGTPAEKPGSRSRPPRDRALDRLLIEACRLTGAEAGAIFVLRRLPRQAALLQRAARQDSGRPGRLEGATIRPDSPAIAAHVVRSGEIVMLADIGEIGAAQPYRFLSPPPQKPSPGGACSLLCFPLHDARGAVIGAVELIDRRREGEPQPFADRHLHRLSGIAQAIAFHLESVGLRAKIRAQSRVLGQHNYRLALQRRQIAALQAESEEGFLRSIAHLARAAEIHDQDTGNHIARVNEYSYYHYGLLGMPADFYRTIRSSAQLHDVGKMSIDAAVLKKRTTLDAAERREMMNHPLYGHRILAGSQRLEMAAEIALHHHEKWDGSGYPGQMMGEDIPISARIVALADVYDALRAARPYKPALSHAETMQILLAGDDRIRPESHFDPALLALLGSHDGGLDAIWRRLSD